MIVNASTSIKRRKILDLFPSLSFLDNKTMQTVKNLTARPLGYKKNFSCLTQLSMNFILLINVKNTKHTEFFRLRLAKWGIYPAYKC